jgi:hypothetical protein
VAEIAHQRFEIQKTDSQTHRKKPNIRFREIFPRFLHRVFSALFARETIRAPNTSPLSNEALRAEVSHPLFAWQCGLFNDWR